MKLKKRMLSYVIVLSLLVMTCSFPSFAADGGVVYGSGNAGMDCTITAGGVYTVASGATGTITVATSDPVTLVGGGIEAANKYSDLSIDCSGQVSNLTIQDLYIDNTASRSVIIFDGTDNELTIAGECQIDHNVGGSPNAVIHVDNNDSLTIRGDGTLYLYKSGQGAGIGGDTGQLNGSLTFDMEGGYLFGKGTKQGALIGAGANSASSGTPGAVEFVSGTYNVMTNSRAGCIGGSAGADGASAGTRVIINQNACVNINVDWTGAAIGGGGYSNGNDASGGILVVNGGSLRCFIDQNAIANWGLTEAGVNDKPITALKQDSSGQTVYRMTFDTASLETAASTFDVEIDGTEFYSGGLHKYGYVNENYLKDGQQTISSTPTNWYENGETNLYFYVTGEDHTVSVNGEEFTASWDEDSQTFALAEAESAVSECRAYLQTDAPAAMDANGSFTADVMIQANGVPEAGQIAITAENAEITNIECNEAVQGMTSGGGVLSFYQNENSAVDGLKLATVTVTADGSGKDVKLTLSNGLWCGNGVAVENQMLLGEDAEVSVGIVQITDETAGSAEVSVVNTDNGTVIRVSCASACRLVATADGGQTYSKVTAVLDETTGCYDFAVDEQSGQKYVLAVIGDANGDGQLSNSDVTRLKAVNRGVLEVNNLERFQLLNDVNSDGQLSNSDVTRLKAALRNAIVISW